ncbi:MAG: hypothetical protein ACE5I7_15070 [Candidatus Binatia bacterium]
MITRLAIISCPCCGGAVDVTRHAVSNPPALAIWHIDTRRIIVNCPECEQFFMPFAYPLFNWVPSKRVVFVALLLDLLVSVLLISVMWYP